MSDRHDTCPRCGWTLDFGACGCPDGRPTLPLTPNPRTPMNKSTLEELLRRVEGATEGSRELDADLWIAVGPRPMGDNFAHWIHDWEPGWEPGPYAGAVQMVENGGVFTSPEFTASLDASLALVTRVLPGSGWQITNTGGSSSYCMISQRSEAGDHTGDGATPVLAVVAALLKALISQAEGREK